MPHLQKAGAALKPYKGRHYPENLPCKPVNYPLQVVNSKDIACFRFANWYKDTAFFKKINYFDIQKVISFQSTGKIIYICVYESKYIQFTKHTKKKKGLNASNV